MTSVLLGTGVGANATGRLISGCLVGKMGSFTGSGLGLAGNEVKEGVPSPLAEKD